MTTELLDKKLSELAKFNAEKDKTIFADWYLAKMAELQKEYDRRPSKTLDAHIVRLHPDVVSAWDLANLSALDK